MQAQDRDHAGAAVIDSNGLILLEASPVDFPLAVFRLVAIPSGTLLFLGGKRIENVVPFLVKTLLFFQAVWLGIRRAVRSEK